jgi:hypothetical protein
MNKVFPSLSSDGFIEDRSILSKKLFEMFLASDHSQSNFKDAQSLKYILNTETVDDYAKNEEIRKSLEKLYNAYFDSVIVSVGNKTDDDNVVVFNMQIDASYNGKVYTIKESISNDYFTDIDKFDSELVGYMN